ncbi:MAG: mechanosensitive ion channel, partial [Desulfobulbaceae bacterium]|nr:mechanosensitive ion channel [Desulfobulbaceae bacterium]
FLSFPLQLQRLRSELKKSGELAITIPSLGSPPYTQLVFNEIRSFQKEVDLNFVDLTKDVSQLEKKLTLLQKSLESHLFEYARMKKDEGKRVFAFERAAYIYRFQVQYSTLTLRHARQFQQLGSLQSLREKGVELIKNCLKYIHISDSDLLAEKEELDRVTLKQNKFVQEVKGETELLEEKLLRFELQLEKVEEKLTTEANLNKQHLKVEKKRLDSIIDTIDVKRKDLEQKKLNYKLAVMTSTFSLYRLNHYAGNKEGENIRDGILFWREKQGDLAEILKALNDELLQISLQKSQLQQKLLLAGDEHTGLANIQEKKTISSLERQLAKEHELIEVLTASMLDNKNDALELINEIRWFTDFLQLEMPFHENLQVYFDENLKKTWQTTLSVLYYPFFSLGETSLTLAALMKFVSLLVVVLLLLRFLRAKALAILHQRTSLSLGAVTSITTLAYYFSVVFGVFGILSAVGVNLSHLAVIFGALGVGIGFGLQTIVNNFMSGIILLSEQVIKVGDIVNLESGVTGEVKRVAIRSTVIRTVNGDDVIVPNSEFVSGRVNTWTYGDDWRRLTVPFGVSYGSDPDEIVRIAEETAREVEITREDEEHPIKIFFEGFGDSSLDFSIRVWCRMHQLRALSGLRSDYYFLLFKKLKDAGVTIPFPQRDLHLQSIASTVKDKLDKMVPQDGDDQ